MSSRAVATIRRHPRLLFAFIVALTVTVILCIYDRPQVLVPCLIGWDVFIWLYLVLIWHYMLKADHEDIKRVSQVTDPGALAILGIFCLGGGASIAAIVHLLGSDSSQHITHSLLALIFFTVTGAWLLIPSLFTLHYAHEFYRSNPHAPVLLFPDKTRNPNYLDVAYFSFTISLAAQTSDIALGGRKMRVTVLLHSILSFLFNTTILGLNINLLSNVVR